MSAGDELISSTDTGELRRRAVRGGAVTFASQIVRFALQLISTVLLARLLTPGDHGLIAMAATVVGFVALFKDLGLSMATVQQRQITHRQVSNLFWINVGLSFALMLVTAALAPTVAWFYHEPRLVGITVALACCFILGGLTAQHQAILQRQMRFSALSFLEIASLAAGTATAVSLALSGAGYWSLVGLTAGSASTRMFVSWILTRWRPAWPSFAADIRSILSFGSNLTGFSILNFLTRNLDNLLIGRYLGGASLGLYAKVYNLLLLPLQQINAPVTGVVLPALSRVQDDPARYKKFYLIGLQLIAACGMPVVVMTFVTADAWIPALLGSQWTASVPIYRILAVAAFVDTINIASGWVYMSLGHTNRMFRWQVFESGVTASAFVVGLNWGVIGVAGAFAASRLLLRFPALAYCYRDTPISLRDVIKVLWCPASAAIWAGSGLWWLRPLWRGQSAYSEWLDLGISGLVYALCYVLLWLIVPSGRKQFTSLLALAVEMFRSRKQDA